MRLAGSTVAILAIALIPGAAWTSPVDARLSTKGLAFIETQVKALVPSHIDLDPITFSLSDTACSNGPITFTQENTHLDITLESFKLQALPGALRIDAVVTLVGTGEGHFERVYACFGRETCGEAVGLEHAHFTIDLAASVDAQGKPHIAIQNPVIDIKPENLALSLSECPEAGIVNTLYDFVEKYALQIGTFAAGKLVASQVGPQIEGILASYMTYKGSAGFVGFQAALTGVDISTAGLTIAGDLDLTSVYPAASCLASDPGEPKSIAGAVPDLSSGTPTDISLAVNLGVVQDAIYHVWHEGLFCISPDTLATFKIDLSALGQLGNDLPGYPADTKWTVAADVGVPPTVEGSPADEAKLTVHANQVALDVIATLPDRTSRTLHVDLDATLTASVVMDPADNALALQIDGARIDRMTLVDHLGLGPAGADLAHIQSLIETEVLPKALSQVGQIPITGPVFGGIANAYVILRQLKTTPAYLMVKADLFMAPAVDADAPTTLITSAPDHVVKPSDARVVFGGTDKQDPTELLKYRVTVAGKAADPTYVRSVTVGTAGASGLVHVEVHAIDLAGNEDKAGTHVDVDVDGVPPNLTVTDDLRGAVDQLTPTMKFKVTDDRTASAAIAAHLTVTERNGPGGVIMDKDLAVGATSATVTGVVSGHSYQAVLVVSDQAGNASSATMDFDVASDASGAGGCAVGDRAGGLASLVLVAGALLLARRRRYRSGIGQLSPQRRAPPSM